MPVVLLGGINTTRALGLGGIPVIVASCDPEEPAFDSRYCRERCLLPPLDDGLAVARVLETLGETLAARHGRRVALAYANDDYLRLLYQHRERLERVFLVLLNPTGLGLALLDKDRFAELARALGLPVPASYDWEALAAARGPVVAKPRSKVGWGESPLLASLFANEAKCLVFGDGREARAHPIVAMNHDRLVFQQFIDGDDEQHWCVDGVATEEGTVLAGYAGRKLRCFPPMTGESCYIELARNPGLEAIAQDVARRLRLRGIFNMDFKRDARTGRYYLLEINTRFNLWLYMAARNGCHLARVLFDYLGKGVAPRADRYGTAYRWLDFRLDRAARRRLASEGKLTWARWAGSLLAAPKVYTVFGWSDPWPFVHMQWRRLRRGMARVRPKQFAG